MIKLKAKTRHAKNVIAKFGKVYHIEKEESNKYLIKSKCGEDLRWVEKPTDIDFEYTVLTKESK